MEAVSCPDGFQAAIMSGRETLLTQGEDPATRRVCPDNGQPTTNNQCPTFIYVAGRAVPVSLSKSMARILLIEDDEAIRTLLREYLAREGHEVTTASNGREGLEMFRPGGFDLVITDLIMPEMEGIEVLQELRQRDTKIPALAMSGGGQFGAAETYLRLAALLGAGRVLAKPFTREQFLAGVNDALGRRSDE